MKTMYFVRYYSDAIHELEVEKVTEKCLWYRGMRNVERSNERESHCSPGQRILKSSVYHETFETIDEAVQHIRQRYARRIANAESSLAHYREQSTAFDKAVIVLLGETPVQEAN